jgi:hypothetical protein
MPKLGRGDTAGEDAALDTVMKAAVLLQESGQSTSMTMVAVDRLNMGVGIRSTLILMCPGISRAFHPDAIY